MLFYIKLRFKIIIYFFLIFCSSFVLFPWRCLYYGLSLSNRNKNAKCYNLCQWQWRSWHEWGMFYLVLIGSLTFLAQEKTNVIGFENRRLGATHLRFVDCRCSFLIYLKKTRVLGNENGPPGVHKLCSIDFKQFPISSQRN